MPLFIPTSRIGELPFAGWPTTKGQLYNLDANEYIEFQFNPETFEFEQEIHWAEITWKGSTFGGDLDFINTGPHTFDLSLLYLADPGADIIGSRGIAYRISHKDDKLDFAMLKQVLDEWRAIIPAKRRPSRIKVLLGENEFDGVVVRWHFRILNFFPDMTAKEVLMTISFREWLLNAV